MPRTFTYPLLAFAAVQNAITRSFDYREDSETLSTRPTTPKRPLTLSRVLYNALHMLCKLGTPELTQASRAPSGMQGLTNACQRP